MFSVTVHNVAERMYINLEVYNYLFCTNIFYIIVLGKILHFFLYQSFKCQVIVAFQLQLV